MRLSYASFNQMPMPIKYSASITTCWVCLQGLTSTQLEKDFSLGIKWTGQGCILPWITSGRRQRECLFGSSVPSHIDKTAEQQKPDSSVASSVQSSALRLELGSFGPQLIGLTGKIGMEWESNRSGEEKKSILFGGNPMPCQSVVIQYK